jgi:RNA polymerase sigma-70 factor (ECF subfamily)
MAYAVAYRILGHPDSAADTVQDALLSAYRGLPAFRNGSFKGWLLRIVANACYDRLRTAAHRRQSYLEDTAGNSEHAPILIDHAADPEEAVLRQETMQAIEAGIARLPYNQRLVVLLSDVQGFGYDEIAQVTGASPGAVKSRLSRARHNLREYLTRELAPGAPASGFPSG